MFLVVPSVQYLPTLTPKMTRFCRTSFLLYFLSDSEELGSPILVRDKKIKRDNNKRRLFVFLKFITIYKELPQFQDWRFCFHTGSQDARRPRAEGCYPIFDHTVHPNQGPVNFTKKFPPFLSSPPWRTPP